MSPECIFYFISLPSFSSTQLLLHHRQFIVQKSVRMWNAVTGENEPAQRAGNTETKYSTGEEAVRHRCSTSGLGQVITQRGKKGRNQRGDNMWVTNQNRNHKEWNTRRTEKGAYPVWRAPQFCEAYRLDSQLKSCFRTIAIFFSSGCLHLYRVKSNFTVSKQWNALLESRVLLKLA